MPKKRYSSEQIINSLREAEVLLSQGSTSAQAARHLGITEQTYYRWRKELENENVLKVIQKANISIYTLFGERLLRSGVKDIKGKKKIR